LYIRNNQKKSLLTLLIKIISPLETYAVRHPELRKGKLLSSCAFQGDELPSSIHLGAFLNKNLIGVASFMANHTEDSSSKKQMQLRGMAILETEHQKGFGAQILKEGELILKKQGCELLWMNARIKAVGFYERLGYVKVGGAFEISEVGLHYKMLKNL
jgi:GNAT superfamily N-acetyltransferase